MIKEWKFNRGPQHVRATSLFSEALLILNSADASNLSRSCWVHPHKHPTFTPLRPCIWQPILLRDKNLEVSSRDRRGNKWYVWRKKKRFTDKLTNQNRVGGKRGKRRPNEVSALDHVWKYYKYGPYWILRKKEKISGSLFWIFLV